jgi:hypothetical protein
MIEVRRGLYVDEATTERRPRYEAVRAGIERAVVRAGILRPVDTLPGRD